MKMLKVVDRHPSSKRSVCIFDTFVKFTRRDRKIEHDEGIDVRIVIHVELFLTRNWNWSSSGSMSKSKSTRRLGSKKNKNHVGKKYRHCHSLNHKPLQRI